MDSMTGGVYQQAGMSVFIIFSSQHELAHVGEVILHQLILLLLEPQELLFCVSLQGCRLEGGDEILFEIVKRHVYTFGFREKVRILPCRVVSFHVGQCYQNTLSVTGYVIKSHQIPLDALHPVAEFGLITGEYIRFGGNGLSQLTPVLVEP